MMCCCNPPSFVELEERQPSDPRRCCTSSKPERSCSSKSGRSCAGAASALGLCSEGYEVDGGVEWREPPPDAKELSTASSWWGTSNPNFSGQWVCSKVENLDAYMEDLGVGWWKRSAASMLGNGVGTIRSIRHDGDDIACKTLGTPTEFEQRFRVGGGQQETKGPEGNLLVKPCWESGGVLVVEQSLLDGSMPNTWRQSLLGGTLVVEMVTQRSVRAVFHFLPE